MRYVDTAAANCLSVRAILVALILLVPAASGVYQARHEADRSATIPATLGTLDVLEVLPSINPGNLQLSWTGNYGVADEEYLLFSADDAERCSLDGTLKWAEPMGCEFGRLQGIMGELMLVCFDRGDAEIVLAAYNSTGRQQWEIVPGRDFPMLEVAGGGVTAPNNDGGWSWACDGSAIVGNFAVVPFMGVRTGGDGVRHVLLKIDSSGDIAWSSSIDPAAAPQVFDPDTATTDARNAFLPRGVAATSSGYVVTGLVPCLLVSDACRPEGGQGGFMSAVAWFDLAGQGRGFELPRPKDQATTETQQPLIFAPRVSAFASADGPLAAVQLGGRAIFIDPSTAGVEWTTSIDIRETGDSPSNWPAPIWQDHRVAVATDRAVSFLGPVSFEQVDEGISLWPTKDRSERIVDLIGDSLGRLYILTAKFDDDAPLEEPSKTGTLYRLGRDGSETMSLPVPTVTRRTTSEFFALNSPTNNALLSDSQVYFQQGAKFLPINGELFIMDAAGQLVRIGTGAQEPEVGISTLYPGRDLPVILTVPAVGNPSEVWVRWGDGEVQQVPWNGSAVSLEHAYANSARHDLLVTVVDADQTTRTAQFIIDVGGTAPAKLTPIQQAFSPEYAETTWGLIGLAVALIGGLFGVWRIRRGRSKLRKGIKRLGEIRELARKDSVAGLAELQELRRGIQDRAAAGYYDQSQMQVLETRAASAARTILFHSVESFRDRLTPVYQGLLASIFEDGIIGDHEAKAALAGLKQQGKLKPAERERLTAMIHVLNPT